MKIFGLGQHRLLLFRSYLVIVGGLIVIAGVLDFSLDRLQNQGPPISGQWINGNLSLIETQLLSLPVSEWPAAVDELEHALGFPVRVFPSDHVVHADSSDDTTQEVFDAGGHAAYIRTSPLLNSVIQIGPLAEYIFKKLMGAFQIDSTSNWDSDVGLELRKHLLDIDVDQDLGWV